MNRILTAIILLLSVGLTTQAQEQVSEEPQAPEDLKTQFNILKDKAETYGEYKVFKISRLDDFWSIVNDSIQTIKNDLESKQNTLGEQNIKINELQATAKENEQRFQQNEFAASHINFIGIDFSKSTFIIGASIIIGGLTLILVLGYIQFIRSRQIALESASECKKLENELEDLRKKSLEKQIKLNRDLQTERNKIEELRNKSTISKRISA